MMKSGTWLCYICFYFAAFQTFSQDSFQKLYSGPGDDGIVWLTGSNDGNLILVGNTTSYDASGDGLIMKTDMQGNIIWSKIYGGSGWDDLEKIISCSEGGYVAIGYTNSFGQGDRDAWIIRIDENGQVMWSDCYGTYSWDGARGIIQTANGSFLIIGQNLDFYNGFILSIDSQGNFLWDKEYTRSTSAFWFNNIFDNGNGGFYIIGAINYNGFGIHDTFILEADQNWNIIRAKAYGGSLDDSFRDLIPYGGGFLAIGDTWSYQAPQSGWIVQLGADLSVRNALVIGETGINNFCQGAWVNANSIFFALRNTDHTAYIVELDPNLDRVNSWQFRAGSFSSSVMLSGQADGSILFTGYATDEQSQDNEAYLVKFDPQNTSYDCNTVTFNSLERKVLPQSADFAVNQTNSSAAFEKINIQVADATLVTDDLCIQLPIADFTGPDQACVYDPVSFTNNSLYGDTYQWYFEGAVPATSDSIDPGIITYENPGYYIIKLVVSNEYGSDSLVRYITVYPLPGIYLGNDTSLSPGQTYNLDAGNGMDNYLWQDGSSGQTFEVTQEGEYWVLVEKDLCYSSDTIRVKFDDCTATLFIPNCFTPNNDGFNETFKPVSLYLSSFSMLIFNRWGQLLYETDDPENGWNGKLNGARCSQGTYFYLIRFTTTCSSGLEQEGIRKGSVTLLE